MLKFISFIIHLLMQKMKKKIIEINPYLTKNYKFACLMLFFMNILNLISFLSPYWIKTKTLIDHEITNLGLWEICFNDFQNIQMARKIYLDGCKQILSTEMFQLRYWFLPNWMKGVQLLCISNFALTLSTLFLIVISIFTRLKGVFYFIIFIIILIIIQGNYRRISLDIIKILKINFFILFLI